MLASRCMRQTLTPVFTKAPLRVAVPRPIVSLRTSVPMSTSSRVFQQSNQEKSAEKGSEEAKEGVDGSSSDAKGDSDPVADLQSTLKEKEAKIKELTVSTQCLPFASQLTPIDRRMQFCMARPIYKMRNVVQRMRRHRLGIMPSPSSLAI